MSNVVLSASKLSSFSKCSWIYYMNYELGIKSGDNDGSRRGGICHIVFECLLKESRKNIVDKIIQDKTIVNCLSVMRLINKLSVKNNLEPHDNKGQDNFDLINSMIYVGLSLDFYCDGGVLEKAETSFNFDAPDYSIRGVIDKIAKYSEDYKIFDYKSSASKYSGEEKDFNVQSLMYALWFYKLYGCIPFFRFIFLRFEKDPFIDKTFTKEEILGFEQYLIYVTKFLNDFTLEKGMSDMAGDKGYPKKEEGFSGLLVCGYAKHPGHCSSKTGKPYYCCSYKFPATYYYIKDKDKKLKYVAKSISEIKLERDDTFEEFSYAGCPAHYPDKYNQ